MDEKNKIHVPEQLTGDIEKGFITTFWRSKEALPVLSGLDVPWYYLQRGFRTLTGLPMSTAVTIITIAVSLFLFSGAWLVLQNIDRILSNAGRSQTFTIYFKEGASGGAVDEFLQEIAADRSVRSHKYRSKDEALELFRKELGPSRQSILDGLGNDNPLPSSVEIELYDDELGINITERLSERLRKREIVDDVVHGGEWVETVNNLLRVFRVFGTCVLLIILGIVVFVVTTTIKLVIYSKRDEIAIMQLVGATRGFVQTPFIIAGIVQGILGWLFSIFSLHFAHLIITRELERSTLFQAALPQIMFLGGGAIAAVGLLAVLLGALGSFFALGKFLNV